jgi:preprotein translocase subunit Sec63
LQAKKKTISEWFPVIFVYIFSSLEKLNFEMAATAAGLDYYSILGISQDSSSDDIKKSYRKLAMKFHPEKNTSHDATEKFRKISEAFDVLNDGKS